MIIFFDIIWKLGSYLSRYGIKCEVISNFNVFVRHDKALQEGLPPESVDVNKYIRKYTVNTESRAWFANYISTLTRDMQSGQTTCRSIYSTGHVL